MPFQHSLRIIAALITVFLPHFLSAGNEDDPVESIYKVMTLRERVGQLLMYGFRGKESNAEVSRYIKEYKVGGIILFSMNITDPYQAAKLCSELNELNKLGIPLFIATDQEGGRVIRIRKGMTILPGNMAIGATRSEDLAYFGGRITGMELGSIGINMNLAPVVDLNSTPKNQVIGIRSYGDIADLVGRQSYLYVKGLQEENVIATAKHFPGHGGTIADSHHGLPTVKRDLGELQRHDLKPFVYAIDAGVDTIMTAHVHYKAFDEKPLAASLSRNVIEYLRREMKFDGVVMADSMEMGAITKSKQIGAAAIGAIDAGNDMIIAIWNAKNKERIYTEVWNAVNNGRISSKRLHDAVCNIIRLKLKYRMFLIKDIEPTRITKVINRKFNKRVADEIAQRAITLIKNSKGIIPIDPEYHRTMMVISQDAYFLELMTGKYPGIMTELLQAQNFKQGHSTLNRRLMALGPSVSVFVIALSADWEVELFKPFYTRFKNKTVLCSFGSPYFILDFPEVKAYLCSYSGTRAAVQAMVEVISGDRKPRGKLPVSMPELMGFVDKIGILR